MLEISYSISFCYIIVLYYILVYSYRMPPILSRLSRSEANKNYYSCRICSQNHGLRKCKVFRKKDAKQRMQLVVTHRYCPNCLAHQHSSSSCFSTKGCRFCGGNHHSLLHIDNPKLRSKKTRTVKVEKSPAGEPPNTSSTNQRSLTIASIATPNATLLFPTAIILVVIGKKKHHIRAVIDPCTAISKISKQFVEELRLNTTVLGSESICAVSIASRHSSHTVLDTTMRVNNHISMDTPNRSIDAAIAAKFANLTLADPKFYISGPFSIVLGSDIYGRIILPGLLASDGSLPVATNTIFGWVLSGSCTT